MLLKVEQVKDHTRQTKRGLPHISLSIPRPFETPSPLSSLGWPQSITMLHFRGSDKTISLTKLNSYKELAKTKTKPKQNLHHTSINELQTVLWLHRVDRLHTSLWFLFTKNFEILRFDDIVLDGRQELLEPNHRHGTSSKNDILHTIDTRRCCEYDKVSDDYSHSCYNTK